MIKIYDNDGDRVSLSKAEIKRYHEDIKHGICPICEWRSARHETFHLIQVQKNPNWPDDIIQIVNINNKKPTKWALLCRCCNHFILLWEAKP